MALRGLALQYLPCALFNTSASHFAASVELVKQLRGQTGAPISEVKAALAETGWDIGESFGSLPGWSGEASHPNQSIPSQ